MSRSSSPARLHLPAVIVGLFALVAAGCSGSPANPTSPLSLTGSTSVRGGAAPSSAGKVDVCHLNDTGGYQMINVSANSLSSHLAHGDGQPLGAVPGVADKKFDAACAVLTLHHETVTLVSGSSGGVGSLDPAISYAKASGGTGTAVILLKHPFYASLAGAQWVNWSILTTGEVGYGSPHGTSTESDDVTYSTDFTLPDGAMNVSLSGTFYADNRGDGFLNGAPIGGHPASPFGGGFGTAASVGTSSGFVSGTNTLSFKVQDWGGVAGLTFAVTITYSHWAP